MGFKSYDQAAKEMYRRTVSVPSVSGNYAEFITFGPCAVGQNVQYFREITALVENFVAGSVIELWLPRVPDGSEPVSSEDQGDYFNSGLTPLSAAGAVRWSLSAWPGAQIRVKSGGTAGLCTISAAGF